MLREDDSHGCTSLRPGGHDSARPSQGEWVRSLVEELRSRKLHRVARGRARWRTEEGAENRSGSKGSEWEGPETGTAPWASPGIVAETLHFAGHVNGGLSL